MGSTDGQVDHAIAVEIAQVRYRTTEFVKIRLSKSIIPFTFRVADLLVSLDRAVRVQKQDPNRTQRATLKIVEGIRETKASGSADGQVGRAVAVEVTQVRYGTAEEVTIIECTFKVACDGADFFIAPDRAVRVQEKNPHCAPITVRITKGAPIVVRRHADGQISHPIAVEIAQARCRTAEEVFIVETPCQLAL